MRRPDIEEDTISSGAAVNPPASAVAGSSPSLWHVAVLFWVGTLWGIQPALIKFAIGRGLSEIGALALVLTSIAVFLGTVLAARGRLFPLTRPVLAFMAIGGILEYVAPLLATFVAAAHVDAGLLTLIMSTSPIFVVAFAAAIGDEALNRDSVLACAIGIAAMALIAIPENALPSRDMLPWCLLGFAAPVFYACGSVYVARAWPEGFDPTQVAFCGSAMASVMLTPFWLEPLLSGDLFTLTPSAYGALLVLAATIVLEMVSYFYLLQKAGPVFASFSSFVMIASGFVAGAVLFGERPSPWVWASVALFSLALVLIIRPGRRESAAT